MGENTVPEPEQQPEQEQQQEPELIFGKYKSLAEAERAYKEAERKIHEQGQKLSELQKALEAEPVLPDLAEDVGWDGLDQMQGLAEQAQFSPEQFLTREQRLAAIAQATARHVDQRFGSPPGQLTVEDVAVRGAALVESVLPDWNEETQTRAIETLARTPSLAAAAQQALTSGDPSSFATLLMAASHQAQQETAASLRQTLTEREKLMAQSASGAGPARIDSNPDAEEWQKIVRAGTGSYSDLRRGF